MVLPMYVFGMKNDLLCFPTLTLNLPGTVFGCHVTVNSHLLSATLPSLTLLMLSKAAQAARKSGRSTKPTSKVSAPSEKKKTPARLRKTPAKAKEASSSEIILDAEDAEAFAAFKKQQALEAAAKKASGSSKKRTAAAAAKEKQAAQDDSAYMSH